MDRSQHQKNLNNNNNIMASSQQQQQQHCFGSSFDDSCISAITLDPAEFNEDNTMIVYKSNSEPHSTRTAVDAVAAPSSTLLRNSSSRFQTSIMESIKKKPIEKNDEMRMTTRTNRRSRQHNIIITFLHRFPLESGQ